MSGLGLAPGVVRPVEQETGVDRSVTDPSARYDVTGLSENRTAVLHASYRQAQQAVDSTSAHASPAMAALNFSLDQLDGSKARVTSSPQITAGQNYEQIASEAAANARSAVSAAGGSGANQEAVAMMARELAVNAARGREGFYEASVQQRTSDRPNPSAQAARAGQEQPGIAHPVAASNPALVQQQRFEQLWNELTKGQGSPIASREPLRQAVRHEEHVEVPPEMTRLKQDEDDIGTLLTRAAFGHAASAAAEAAWRSAMASSAREEREARAHQLENQIVSTDNRLAERRSALDAVIDDRPQTGLTDYIASQVREIEALKNKYVADRQMLG